MDSYAAASLDVFDKIRQAVGGADCFILFHQRSDKKIHKGVLKRPHYIVTNDDLSGLGYSGDISKSLVPGKSHFPLAHFFRKHRYSYYWYIEYDVRFSGRWEDFFSFFDKSEDDFITSHIRFHSDEPTWFLWDTFKHTSEEIPKADMLRSFNPIYRVSSKALEFVDQKQKEGCDGHHETLFVTLLYNAGFLIRDFGGFGPFVQKEDKGRFYIDSTTEDMLDGSMRVRPEQLFLFNKQKNKLYHPIKTKKILELPRLIPSLVIMIVSGLKKYSPAFHKILQNYFSQYTIFRNYFSNKKSR
jgi:hypothetical protein